MEKDINLSEPLSLLNKLHQETGLIPWKELQRFFAQGVVMWVHQECDLVETGALLAEDESEKIKLLQESDKFLPVSTAQAKMWYQDDTMLWSLVVAPFVLVQEQ